jgi:hypothetical protein
MQEVTVERQISFLHASPDGEAKAEVARKGAKLGASVGMVQVKTMGMTTRVPILIMVHSHAIGWYF